MMPTRYCQVGHALATVGTVAEAPSAEAGKAIAGMVAHLRVARREQRATQAQLAVRIKVSEDSVASYETGRLTPFAPVLFRWARELGHVIHVGAEPTPLIWSAEYSLLRLARALRGARVDAGVMQDELSKTLSVSLWTVGQWECGDRTPRLRHLVQWCALLGHELALTSGSAEYGCCKAA